VVQPVTGTSAQSDLQSDNQTGRLDVVSQGWFNWSSTEKLSPTALFWGESINTPHISLLITASRPHIHCSPNLRQMHSFTPSHIELALKSNRLKEPLVWGFVLVLSDLVFLSPLILISWACCKHPLCNIVVLETLEFLDELRLLGSLQICGRPQQVYIPYSCEQVWEKNPLALVVRLWRIRVEKDPALCRLLNGE
jgi:hypothetical protein